MLAHARPKSRAERSKGSRKSMQATARESPSLVGKLGRLAGRVGIVLEGLKTFFIGLSWNRGFNHLLATGKLPKCVLPPGHLQQLYELCDGEPARARSVGPASSLYVGVAETVQVLASQGSQ